MKEKEFYLLDDTVQEFPVSLTNGYFPLASELKQRLPAMNLVKHAPIILYLASDPYKDSEAVEFDEYERQEYKDTVRLCVELSAQIPVKK